MINSKQKGKRGEREFAAFCREQGYDCRRTQQYCGNTGDASDVVGLPGIHIEVKRPKQITYGYIVDALQQAERDSKEGELPIVAYKEDYGKWHIAMYTHRFYQLYRSVNDALWSKGIMPIYGQTPVNMLAEDWFNIYKECE